MQIIIAGCGKVGSYLCEQLSLEGHDITAADIKKDKVTALTSRFDIMGAVGNIVDPEMLRDLETRNADLFIAVTANDELNLLSCLLARKEGCTRTIARVRSPEYSSAAGYLAKQLGLAMILNPEHLAAREIFRALQLPSSVDADAFSKGTGEILKFRIQPDSGLDQMPVKEIPKIQKDILVCAAERDGQAFIPDGDFVLHNRDRLYIAGDSKSTIQFIERIGLKKSRVRNVMIIGAGKLTYYLVRLLEEAKIRSVIIDNSEEACQKANDLMPRSTIIKGDGSDQNILVEEGLDNMDAFVSLTGMDEENVFLSLFAKNRKHMKTVTKCNRIFIDEVLDTLDLDTVINPKKIIAEYILQYVRALRNSAGSNVETIHKLVSGKVEALEFKVKDGFEAAGKNLQDLSLKQGVLIAMIQRKGRTIVPRGNDMMLPGDSVIVITNQQGFACLEDILASPKGRDLL